MIGLQVGILTGIKILAMAIMYLAYYQGIMKYCKCSSEVYPKTDKIKCSLFPL